MPDKPPLTEAERVINRTRALMENGKARGWSHAMDKAAETVKREDDTEARERQFSRYRRYLETGE